MLFFAVVVWATNLSHQAAVKKPKHKSMIFKHETHTKASQSSSLYRTVRACSVLRCQNCSEAHDLVSLHSGAEHFKEPSVQNSLNPPVFPCFNTSFTPQQCNRPFCNTNSKP